MPTESRPERIFSTREITRLLRLSPKRLGQLRRLGVLGDDGHGVGFRELVAVRGAAALLEAGASVREVRLALEGARRLAPDAPVPLSTLRLSVEGRQVVVEQGALRFDAKTGQALLDLAAGDLEREARESLRWGMVRALGRAAPGPPATADDWFERASEWDGEPERWREAVDAYERVLALEPEHAPAWNNLGLIQHRMGQYQRAGECYRAALAIDPSVPEAAFNLGALHEDQGELESAIAWYRRALAVAPDYADAHFNLAAVLGRTGRREHAARHWRCYLDLDSGSPWAQIARAHLEDAGEPSE
ncbi:MAG: tetratricopeptide repeat protein [Candidatus Rokubacteria bacterium]|nr:tetratricopeptide repeat protein [Candidatus Rokubacteria bacterium]